MTYYMFGIELRSANEVDEVENIIKFLLVSRYNPHLWNSVITHYLLGSKYLLILRKLTWLPPEQAINILRESFMIALEHAGVGE